MRSYRNKVSVGAEYCERKLENYAAIVVAMSVAVYENEMSMPTVHNETRQTPNPPSLSVLLSELISAMENE